MLALAGLALVASQLALITSTRGLTHQNATTFAAVAPLMFWLAVPAGLLLLGGRRLIRVVETPFAWIILVAVGLLMRLVWLGQMPPLDDDYFRYLWDGALVANGLDPYLHAPGLFLGKDAGPEPFRAIAAGAQHTLDNINFNDMRTIYPGAAQVAFAVAHLIEPFKYDGLRVVFIGGEIATFVLLIVCLRTLGQPVFWGALYWWNPLPATMTVGLVHVDALIPPLVLGALILMARDRPNWALVLLGLGAGVKIWPLLLAPMVLWPLLRDPRRLIVACLVLGATLAIVLGPVLVSTLRPGSGLSAYAMGWTNNNAFYAWTVQGLNALLGRSDVAERALRLGLAVATGLIALYQGTRGDATLQSLLRRALIVSACVFYLSPAQFPWYAVWFLPLAVLGRSWPLLLASALLAFYYMFFPQWPLENGSLFFYGIAFIHSVPVLSWLLIEAYQERKRAPATGVTGTT